MKEIPLRFFWTSFILIDEPKCWIIFLLNIIRNKFSAVRRLKPRMIISENTPEELPADVVRGNSGFSWFCALIIICCHVLIAASEKPDLGLEELSGVNIKSRFQMFQSTGENGDKNEDEDGVSNKGPVKRSPSILSKLAK
jgi:hypothetical protein